MKSRIRRLLSLFAVVLAAACGFEPDDDDGDVEQDGDAVSAPAASWHFDEGSGTSVADATGNGRTATLSSGAAFVAGRVGHGVFLNGSTSGIATVADAPALDPGTADFSFTGWIRSDHKAARQYVASKRGICNHGRFWNLVINDTVGSGKLTVEVDGSPTSNAGLNFLRITGQKLVNDNVWHHFAVVRQGTSLKLYVDGVLDGSGATPAPTNIENAAPLKLGASQCSGNFIGSLDEVAYYPAALSAADVAALRNQTPAQANLPPPSEEECSTRVRIRPVLYVPSDATLSASATQSALTLLDQHVAVAQDFYRTLLGTDTFCSVPASVYAASARASDIQYAAPDWAHAITLSLLNHQGDTRTASRDIFLTVFVRPPSLPCVLGGSPTPCWGGARPINGGLDKGGGIIGMEYSSLIGEVPYAFHSTVVHEIGHSLGLAHGDCHGESMSSGFSIMVYNLSHKSNGLTPSATPGGFIAEQYFLLDKNNPALPAFKYLSAFHNPTGKSLVRVDGECTLGTMGPILDVAGPHSGYDLYWATNSPTYTWVGGAEGWTLADARNNCDWNIANQPPYRKVLCLFNGDVIGSRG